MTDKEYNKFWAVIILFIGFLCGLAVGGFVVSLQYDSDIRTDQAEIKEQVEGILADKQIIDDIVQTLLFQVEQLKKERQEVRELKILLSKGEKND